MFASSQTRSPAEFPAWPHFDYAVYQALGRRYNGRAEGIA
jgi:hypothetical protein